MTNTTLRRVALNVLDTYFALRLDGDTQAQFEQHAQVEAWLDDGVRFPLELADDGYHTMLLRDDGYATVLRVKFDAEGTATDATIQRDDEAMPTLIYTGGEFHAKD